MAISYSGQFNLEKLRQSLYSKQAHINEAMAESVEKGAEEIRDEAKANAPVDTHNLEDAIHIVKRDTRAGNVAYDVEVSGAGSMGRDVEEYAMLAHQEITPYGPKNLGPRSQEKQNSDPEHTVGGGFMDRAVEAKKAEVIENVKKAVRAAVKNV